MWSAIPAFERLRRQAVVCCVGLAVGTALAVSGCAAPQGRNTGPVAIEPHLIQTAAVDRPQAGASAGVAELGQTAWGNYLAGRFAHQQRDFGMAATFLSRAANRDSKNVRLLRRTLMVALADGQMDLAFDLSRKIIALDPEGRLATMTLAVSDALAGDLKKAEARLTALPQRGLAQYMGPLLAAWAIAGQGRYDEAIATLAPLKDRSGFSILHDLHVGLIDRLAGRGDAAEASFKSAMNSSDRMSLRLVLALGRLYEREGRTQEARQLYDRFNRENPDSFILDGALSRLDKGAKPPTMVDDAKDGMAEAFYNVAGTLTRESSAQIGLIYGRLALALKPDFPTTQILVGSILESLGRPTDAIEVYDGIVATAPQRWSSQLRKATTLSAAGETDKAAALLETLADERPERADALIILGDVLRYAERFEGSVKAYDRAFERIGDIEERHWSLLYHRGIVLERSKQWARAEADFLKALELQPDQPYVLNYLGYSWVDQGTNLDRGREMIERAVELRPNDGYIVDSLGWALYRLRNFDGAVAHLERAVAIRPRDPTINDHLGDALWRVGRRIEARFQWQRALSMEPETNLVPQLEHKLESGLPELKDAGRRI